VTIPPDLMKRIDDVLDGVVERDPALTAERSPRRRHA
jgi:hypothetical protein